MSPSPSAGSLSVRRSASASAAAVATLAGVCANILMGASSLYWRELGDLGPAAIVCYRVLLSLPTLLIAMAAYGQLVQLRSKIDLKVLGIHLAAAGLIVVNWTTFIWSAIHGHVVESGLGYLIAPCVAIGVGVGFFGDKLDRVRALALAVIGAAVVLLIAKSGELNHGVYLAIGGSWGIYACLKKLTRLDALSGLLVETLFLSIGCIVLLMASPVTLAIPENFAHHSWVMLILAGVASVFPLVLFAYAAGKLSLSVMGLLQFVLPTTQFAIALLVYRQDVSHNSVIAFALIWLALFSIVARPFFRSRLGRP